MKIKNVTMMTVILLFLRNRHEILLSLIKTVIRTARLIRQIQDTDIQITSEIMTLNSFLLSILREVKHVKLQS